MRTASEELLTEHYPSDAEWLGIVGQKTLETYARYGGDPVAVLGTSDAVEIGRIVKGWLVKHMASGKIVVAVVVGNHAIDAVRKLVGATIPLNADPGTIRGMLSTDSPDLANEEMRPVRNLVHASGDPEEAAREIALWFGDEREPLLGRG